MILNGGLLSALPSGWAALSGAELRRNEMFCLVQFLIEFLIALDCVLKNLFVETLFFSRKFTYKDWETLEILQIITDLEIGKWNISVSSNPAVDLVL